MLISGSEEFILFSLILMRMMGATLLNPIFRRRAVPTMLRLAIGVTTAIVVYPTAQLGGVVGDGTITYGLLLLKEFGIGFVLGFVFDLFEMVTLYAGQVMDMQMGLAMASVYDAERGSQVAMTGNIMQIYFFLLFFGVDGHLAFFRIFMTSGDIVPYAGFSFTQATWDAMIVIFLQCISLMLRLAFPIIAFMLIVEVSIGILMKIIPQINLFVLSIQLRVIIGILMLMVVFSPIGDFLGGLVSDMIYEMEYLLTTLSR